MNPARFHQDNDGRWYYTVERDAGGIPGCLDFTDEYRDWPTKAAAVEHAATVARVPVSLMDMMP
jgi:hypothetical protein